LPGRGSQREIFNKRESRWDMRPFGYVGIVVAGAGAVLVVCSKYLSHAGLDRATDLLAGGNHLHLNWYLLAGMMITLGGGVLAQINHSP
jgi:hypothetical protein